MNLDEIKHLKEQVKNLENQLKVYENHIYILQNDFQFNHKNLQLEQAKHQSQITSLASLFLDVFKENRLYEEQRETLVLERVNNIVNLDINEYAALNGLAGSSTSDASLINSITLNSSTTQNPNSNNTSNTANGDNASNANNNTSLLSSRLGASDQLLSPSLQPNPHPQVLHNQQIQQLQQQQQQALQQPFAPQHHHNQQQDQQSHRAQQVQQQQQQVQQQQAQAQAQAQQLHHIQQQQRAGSNQTLPASSLRDHQPDQANKQRKNKRKQQDDHSSILDDALGYAPAKHIPIIPIMSSNEYNSLQRRSDTTNPSTDLGEVSKRRKFYDKEYSFIKAPSSVEEVWKEYSIGLNGQPSIKSLELEYRTGWRRDPAISKKFNRRKGIYHAIEKGLNKGYTIEYCIRLLEDYRYIDREKNSKQPIGWLCTGNIPSELR